LDRSIARLLRDSGRTVVLAMNKSDRLRPDQVLARCEAYSTLASTEDWTLTIAADGHNLDELWRLIASHLPEGPPMYDGDLLTDQPERVLVAELVRESALLFLQDEVPHGLDVLVTEWSERDDGLAQVSAVVIVEREGQKGIVIGRGGGMLKKIGTRARREAERLLGGRMFLALEVKTKKGWRESAAQLRRLGYD
jgi:GTP-binding protein Era